MPSMTTMKKPDKFTSQSNDLVNVHETDTGGIRFEHKDAPKEAGTPYIDPPKAKSRREAELEAGRQNVARAAEQIRTRPISVKNENELKAEGSTVPVFRPNTVYADAAITNNRRSDLAPLMRQIGSSDAKAISQS